MSTLHRIGRRITSRLTPLDRRLRATAARLTGRARPAVDQMKTGAATEITRTPLAALAAILGSLVLIFGAVSWILGAFSEDITVQPQPAPTSSPAGVGNVNPPESGHPWSEIVGQIGAPTFVLPEALADIPRPPETAGPGATEFREWALGRGGVYANQMAVSFSVTGNTPERLVINDVRIDATCRKPMEGTWLAPVGGDAEPHRILLVDLDTSPPKVTATGQEDWSLGQITVSPDDLELFTLVATTAQHDCEWEAAVVYTDSDGDLQEVPVNDDGQPFRVTGTGNAGEKVYGPRTEDDPWPLPAD